MLYWQTLYSLLYRLIVIVHRLRLLFLFTVLWQQHNQRQQEGAWAGSGCRALLPLSS